MLCFSEIRVNQNVRRWMPMIAFSSIRFILVITEINEYRES